MHKKNLFSILVVLTIIIYPQFILASSFSLRSASKTIEPNKNFTLSIYAQPGSSASYTAQANISFPADLVSVESFTYAPTWFPMSQIPGYDIVDNISGKLIKTAGYPGGFTTETLLGTAVFKSKKAGSISISINKESFIFDMDSNNTLSSYGSFSIVSSTPAPAPTPAPTPKPTTTTPKTNPLSTSIKSPKTNSTPLVPELEVIPELTSTQKESLYKKKIIGNILFLFTGVSLVDQIVSTYLDIN